MSSEPMGLGCQDMYHDRGHIGLKPFDHCNIKYDSFVYISDHLCISLCVHKHSMLSFSDASLSFVRSLLGLVIDCCIWITGISLIHR